MKIENNILAITNCLFKDKQNWRFVTTKQKEQFFFPINRLLAKKYPELAQALNTQFTDTAAALDCWFTFFQNKSYPSWMWSKKTKLTTQDYSAVLIEYDISEKDIDLLKLIDSDGLEQENKWLNKQKSN